MKGLPLHPKAMVSAFTNGKKCWKGQEVKQQLRVSLALDPEFSIF